MFTAVLGDAAKTALASSRFSDVRWVEETGSTNADLLALARDGAPEGIVLVADHQTAGRGRSGRTWTAPPNASLLLSVLVRPAPQLAGLSTMAMGLGAADAVESAAQFRPRLKWPNDLVWPGDGSAPDRKLAGILAEAHWPAAGDAAVVIGIGLNVNWPADLPADLATYAELHPDYPQQSTANQFFDEAQWESYRRLGFEMGSRLFADEETLAEYLPIIFRKP